MLRLLSLVGLIVFLGLAWLMSENRRVVPWRIVLWGLGLQFAFALLVLQTGLARPFFAGVDAVVGVLTDATMEGANSFSPDSSVRAPFSPQPKRTKRQMPNAPMIRR